KKAVFDGETAQFKGKTAFFEGTPVSRVKLTYSGAASGEVETDEKGEFSISFQSISATEYNYPNNNYISIRPTSSEEGEIEAGSYIYVFGAKVNLEAKTQVVQSKGKVAITAKHVDLDKINSNKAKDSMDYLGGPADKLKILGKVTEERWEKKEAGDYYDFINKVVSKRYEYYTVRTPLDNFEVTTNEDGKAEYQFEVGKDKYYEIELGTQDQEGNKVKLLTYLYGSDSNSDFRRYSSYQDNYYYLRKNNPEKAISVGDEVKLTFKKGRNILSSEVEAQFLYILAQRGIKDFQLANQPSFNFIFKQDFAPNIFAQAVYFNGETFVVSEGLPLDFSREDKKLTVDTSTDKDFYRPGETVSMEVAVWDKQGKGEKTEVNLNLIDEAIYKLQEEYVDPLSSLYRSVSSGIIYAYASHEYPLESPQPGGGGGCFLTGTKITMADGRQKNIEEVEKGDYIKTRESENEARMVKDKVTDRFEHVVGSYLLINNILRVTKEHNLFVNGRWMPSGEAKPGDYLVNDANKWIKITSVEEKKGRFKVYNLQTEKTKTFFAQNFYVHNQKGRELFKDKAFFGSIPTDETGKGKVTFRLPDNLTSWRVTSQAISNSLGAGNATSLIPVSLPFFIDVILNNEYLEGDKPLVKLRSFGKELRQNQEVSYTFEAPTLGIEKQLLKGKAFESTFFQPGSLVAGVHKITVGAKAGEYEDKIIRTIKVKKTGLVKLESEYYQLSPGTKVAGNQEGPTTLVFSDQGRGRYYRILNQLKYTFGDRIDQKLARVVGAQLLAGFFGEKEEEKEKCNAANYQTQKGGISLFPYSDDELELSAKTADLALDLFDKEALTQYFYNILNSPQEGKERIAASLYGLAACQEPVLVEINILLERPDLEPSVKLYLGLAAATLGDKETGKRVLAEVMKDYGEELKPYLLIKVGQDKDDILQATSIAADLAILVGEESGEKLFAYIKDNATKDILIYLEDLYYLAKSLPATDSRPVKFAYVLEGKKEGKTLEKGEIFKLQVNKDQLDKIQFEDISGSVGLNSIFTTQFDPGKVKRDTNINISREYEVADLRLAEARLLPAKAGQPTREFGETDLVKVTLNYQIGDMALDGCYQVTDWLPSGFKIIT
ncbi:hypothetical protein FJY90_06530, partial [Candidatus Gottesmanbacteria bacterium]|nr:hypothetical protein [Candidatus Gottesmanbacteria bacterium]